MVRHSVSVIGRSRYHGNAKITTRGSLSGRVVIFSIASDSAAERAPKARMNSLGSGFRANQSAAQ